MPFRPTDEDEKLWNFVTKGVQKYRKANKPAQQPKLSSGFVKEQKNQHVTSPFPDMPCPPVQKVAQEAQLNRRDTERLRKGKIEIQARLDLHGMRQDQAIMALERFIFEAVQKKLRCLLIITGKGSLSSPGILRENLPEWLRRDSLRSYVLKWTQAHQKDGGTGAFYVYLKRK